MTRQVALVLSILLAMLLATVAACDDGAATAPDASGGSTTGPSSDGASRGRGAADAGSAADAAPGRSAAWCEPCTEDGACGPDARCIADVDGQRYCATLCLLSKNECPLGSTCRPYGSKTDEFACQPDYGRCQGGGEPCSPCTDDGDCDPGSVCHTSKIDKVRSCYPSCTDAAQCPDGWGCEGGLCLPFIANKYRQACNVGASGLCEPCHYNYDCAGGRICGPKLGYCTEPCTKDQGLEDSCPEGLFCVDGTCQPPVAHKCQGWLGCAYGCPEGATCEKGVCKSP